MASAGVFPAADSQKELNPGMNKDFQVDSASSDVATSKEIKNKYEVGQKKDKEKDKENKKKNGVFQSFKTTITVSGIVVAVVGAIFAITKKLREK